MKHLLESEGLRPEMLNQWKQMVRLMRRVTPQGDRLTFAQLREQARRNAEAYERFLSSKAPINAWEVRVGEKEFWKTILNDPDGLRETKFERDLPRDGVLQVWCSADGESEAVPLLFQPMEEVSEEGLSYTKNYDNGQSLTLEVKLNEDGEFSVRLLFATSEKAVKDVKTACVAAGWGRPVHVNPTHPPSPRRARRLNRTVVRAVYALKPIYAPVFLAAVVLLYSAALIPMLAGARDAVTGAITADWAPDAEKQAFLQLLQTGDYRPLKESMLYECFRGTAIGQWAPSQEHVSICAGDKIYVEKLHSSLLDENAERFIRARYIKLLRSSGHEVPDRESVASVTLRLRYEEQEQQDEQVFAQLSRGQETWSTQEGCGDMTGLKRMICEESLRSGQAVQQKASWARH